MRNLVLRAIRKILRRLDVSLGSGEARQIAESPPDTNGREWQIEEFLASTAMPDPASAAYFQEHKQRMVRTLSLVPPGHAHSRALELGSYLQMAATLHSVLGYGTVNAAYYAPAPGRDRKTLSTPAGAYTAEIDLFDAESHPFPYADSSLDVVLCCELIEHLIHDPMHMLLESWRVLAHDGLLLITTPNVASLTSVWAALEGKRNPQVFSRYPAITNADTPHVREYTPQELDAALRAAGFEVTALFTERLQQAHHATWVLDILRANGFETALRGEQMYCLARKHSRLVVDRFPGFLYAD